MIVLSDGEPACPPMVGNVLEDHLKSTVREIENSGLVEVIGIGIETSAVRKYYSKCVVLDNLAELPTTVMKELSKILLR